MSTEIEKFNIVIPRAEGDINFMHFLDEREAISADNDYIPIWALRNSITYRSSVNKVLYYKLQIITQRIRRVRGFNELVQIFEGKSLGSKFYNHRSSNNWGYIELKSTSETGNTINRYIATNGLICNLKGDSERGYIAEPLVVTCIKQRVLFRNRTDEEKLNPNLDEFAVIVAGIDIARHPKFHNGIKKFLLPKLAGQIDVVLTNNIIRSCYNSDIQESTNRFNTLDELKEHLKSLNQIVMATL